MSWLRDAVRLKEEQDKQHILKHIDSLEIRYSYMLRTTPYVCPGWMKLIQDMLMEVDATTWPDFLEEGCESFDIKEHPIFTHIIERFGRLHVCGGNISNEIAAIIHKYIVLSAETCMICGNSGGFYAKDGWLYVACDEHEHSKWRWVGKR